MSARAPRRGTALAALTMLAILHTPAPAQLPGWAANDTHKYADAAACEMGARADAYLPAGIKPSLATEIPMTWNERPLRWKPTNLTAGTGEFQYQDGGGIWRSIAADAPETGAKGPITDPTQTSPGGAKQLRCDHYPFVSASCTPHQKIYEVEQGGIRWHILFRRTQAPATDDVTKWGKTHVDYYDVIDAAGLKLDTFATAWLDGLNGLAARDKDNGFRANQAMPRPGGLRPQWRGEGVRASKWFDTTADMRGGTCTNCHATPFNGSDWLAGSGLTSFNADNDRPSWHAGNAVLKFADKLFFDTVKDTVKKVTETSCSSCHNLWMVKAGGTPGGEVQGGSLPLARLMTAVHDKSGANPFKAYFSAAGPGGGARYAALASRWRTDAGEATFGLKEAHQAAPGPDGKRRALQMPPAAQMLGDSVATVAQWKTTYNDQYNMLACCGSDKTTVGSKPYADGIDCTNVTCEFDGGPPRTATIADFYTPWMEDQGVVPEGTLKQKIAAPDPAANATLSLIACPAPPPAPLAAGDKCYEVKWSDPTDPFNAAPRYQWNKATRAVSDPDFTNAERDETKFCQGKGRADVPITDQTQLAAAPNGDRWRYEYRSVGVLPRCQRMMVRLCGAWCEVDTDKNDDAKTRKGRQAANDEGALLTLRNGTDADCATPTPTHTPTATWTPTAPPTASPTHTAAPTVSPTRTANATATFTATPTARPSDTPSPTPSEASTATTTPVDTATAEPTATAEATTTATVFATATDVPSFEPTATPTPDATHNDTPEVTPTATPSPEPTATPTPDATSTSTPDETPDSESTETPAIATGTPVASDTLMATPLTGFISRSIGVDRQ